MCHFGDVDETTKRLVARCVKVKWLREDVEANAYNNSSSNGGVAKKLLGVELLGAMASSLSVVEVAVHKEKPGVQTPSMKEIERRDENNGLLPPTGNGNGDGEGFGADRSPVEIEGGA